MLVQGCLTTQRLIVYTCNLVKARSILSRFSPLKPRRVFMHFLVFLDIAASFYFLIFLFSFCLFILLSDAVSIAFCISKSFHLNYDVVPCPFSQSCTQISWDRPTKLIFPPECPSANPPTAGGQPVSFTHDRKKQQ